MPIQIQNLNLNQLIEKLFKETTTHHSQTLKLMNQHIQYHCYQMKISSNAQTFNQHFEAMVTLKYLYLKWLIEHLPDQLYQFAINMRTTYQRPLLPVKKRNQFVKTKLFDPWHQQWEQLLYQWPKSELNLPILNQTLITQLQNPKHNGWLYFGIGEILNPGISPVLKQQPQNKFEFEHQVQTLIQKTNYHSIQLNTFITLFNNQNLIRYLKTIHQKLNRTHLGNERGLLVLKTRAMRLILILNRIIKSLHRNLDHWFMQLHLANHLTKHLNQYIQKNKQQNYLNIIPKLKP